MSEQAFPGWIVESTLKRSGAAERFEVGIDDPGKAIDALKIQFQDDGTTRIFKTVEASTIVGLALGKVRKI